MDLKKKMKAFFTLKRRADDGFTLVELIVVIAILAILGGVAVPAYSGYVKKANMGADQSLAGEVAHALTLYYYDNPGTPGGYVVLTQGGASAGNDAMTAAMDAAFGDGWENTLSLKYDKWTNNGVLSLVSGYTPEQAQAVVESALLSNGTTKDMMGTVTSLLRKASEVIAGSDIVGKLADIGIADDAIKGLSSKEDQATVVSNVLVQFYSKAIAEGNTNDPMINLMYTYVNAYAYSKSVEDDSYFKAVENKIMETASMNGGYDKLKELGSGDTDWEEVVGEELWGEYITNFGSSIQPNKEALNEMMKAVNLVSGSYTEQKDLLNPDLYASDSVVQQVDSYKNAMQMIADGKTIPTLQTGEVAIMLYPDGSTYASISVEP